MKWIRLHLLTKIQKFSFTDISPIAREKLTVVIIKSEFYFPTMTRDDEKKFLKEGWGKIWFLEILLTPVQSTLYRIFYMHQS
jgi:hypothetical protein